MKYRILNRKFLSFLGLTLIVIGIIATTFLIKGANLLESKASSSDEPRNIKISNTSDTSFTLTYLTSNETIGTLNESGNPDNLDQVILDDRDQLSQKINRYQAHSITVNNLDPETTYYFTITSGDKNITDNGKPFSVKTGPVISISPSSQIPLSGKVINPDGTLPSDGLVLVKINGAQEISSYLKADGSYLIPLNNLRNENLDNYLSLKNNAISIKVISNNLSSSVDVFPGGISPVPIITLSNNYDFSQDTQITEPTKFNSSKSASFRNIVFPKSSKIVKKINK